MCWSLLEIKIREASIVAYCIDRLAIGGMLAILSLTLSLYWLKFIRNYQFGRSYFSLNNSLSLSLDLEVKFTKIYDFK